MKNRSPTSIQLEKDRGKEKREGASNRKTWIDEEEGCCVCVVGLEGNRSL